MHFLIKKSQDCQLPNFPQYTMQFSIESLIHLQVNKVIRDECHCGFQCLISLPDIVCDEQQPNQILYKANIYIYGEYPTGQLVNCIDDWITHRHTATLKNKLVIFGHEFSITGNEATQTSILSLNTSIINATDHILMITIPISAPIVAGLIIGMVLTCLWTRYEMNLSRMHV